MTDELIVGIGTKSSGEIRIDCDILHRLHYSVEITLSILF